jgi:integration host factor subunit beta
MRSIEGERAEIRGFGGFSLNFRKPRRGRNPKTGEAVELIGKHLPHCKRGKELREQVNQGIELAPGFDLFISVIYEPDGPFR